MYDCQTLVNDARKSDIPNTEQWIVKARDTIKQIQENCGRFLENTDSFLQDIQTSKPNVYDTNPAPQVFVEHDPGLRNEFRGDNQREYLVEPGPFQLRLHSFPANHDIPQTKQNRFSPRWYDEYPCTFRIQYQE